MGELEPICVLGFWFVGVLLGAGSFGRVYKGRWHGMDVAVKIIEHDSATAALVANEVKLIMSFDHANVVKAFHCTTWVENPKVPTPPAAGEGMAAEGATSGVLSPVANAWTAGSGLGTLARAGSGAVSVTGAGPGLNIRLQSNGSSSSLSSGGLLPAVAAVAAADAAGGTALDGIAQQQQQQQQHEHSTGSGHVSSASAAVAGRGCNTLPVFQGHSTTSTSTSSSNTQGMTSAANAAADGMGQEEGSSSRGSVARLLDTVRRESVYRVPSGAVFESGGMSSRTFSTTISGAVNGVSSVANTTEATTASRSQRLPPVIPESELAGLIGNGRDVGGGGSRGQASLDVSPAAVAAAAAVTGIPLDTVVEVQHVRDLQQYQGQRNVDGRWPAVVAEFKEAADGSESKHESSRDASYVSCSGASRSPMEPTPTTQQSGQGFSSEGMLVEGLRAMDTEAESTVDANASRRGDVALVHLPSSKRRTSSSQSSGQQRMTHVVMNLAPEMDIDALPMLDIPAGELNRLLAMLPSSSTTLPTQQQQCREAGRRRRSSFDTGGNSTASSGSEMAGRGGEGGTVLVASIPMVSGGQRKRPPRKKKVASEKAQTWLVLEFCDGGTLADLLQSYASTAEEPTSSVSVGLGRAAYVWGELRST